MKNKRLILSVLLSWVVILTIAIPVFAYTYSAPITVTENGTASHDMASLNMTVGNTWLAANGFMSAQGLDTRVETLGGLAKPHMVADNATWFATAVPENGQINLFYTTWNSLLTVFHMVFGNGGWFEVADNTTIELGSNFTLSQSLYVDTSVAAVGANITSKDGAYREWISGTGNVSAAIPSVAYTTNDDNNMESQGATWNSQTFTTTGAIMLDWVALKIYREGNPGTLTVHIRATAAGLPTGADLTSGTIDGNAITSGTGGIWYTIGVTNKALSAATVYAVILSGGADVSNSVHWRTDASAPAYTGGSRVYSVDSGVNWTADANTDGMFALFSLSGGNTVTAPVSSGEHTVAVSAHSPAITTGSAVANYSQSGAAGITRIATQEPVSYNGTLIAFNFFAVTDLTGVEVATIYNVGGNNWTTRDYESVTDVTAGSLQTKTVNLDVRQGDYPVCYFTGGSIEQNNADTGSYVATAAGDQIPCTNQAFTPGTLRSISLGATGYAGLSITVDGVVRDTVDIGATAVPNNANNLEFWRGGAVPYGDNVTLTVGGNVVAYYAPNAMIQGTVLPDRAPDATDNPGTIHWGSNPTGISVVLGGMVSSSQPNPGSSAQEPTTDILPEATPSDWYLPPNMATLITHPLRPFVTILSDSTTLTEVQAWRLLGLVFVLLCTVLTAANVGKHQLITGIVVGVAIGILAQQTVWPTWTLIFAIGAVLGGLVAERTPSL